MKQILLITDGCSNVGLSPVLAAAHAQAEGITVNVVGVTDPGEDGFFGQEEIAEIAKAGGGLSRMAHTRQLSQTVQMLTRQTVVGTIQQAVNRELRHVLGAGSIEELPPEKRGEVVRVMDDLGENAALRVALLIDASASMKPRMAAVEEAIRDLMLSLQARAGRSELAVFHFPASQTSEECALDVGWTTDLGTAGTIFRRLPMRGTTPTGPAIMRVVDFFLQGDYGRRTTRTEMEGIGCDDVV